MIVKLCVFQELGINASDDSRIALDTCRCGPLHEIEEDTPEIREELLAEFINLNPDYPFEKYALVIVRK